MCDIIGAHVGQNGIEIFYQIGKIQVAMRIDEHGERSGSEQLTI